jgi:hypothetical protein
MAGRNTKAKADQYQIKRRKKTGAKGEAKICGFFLCYP